jgi:hypothetical protein
MEEDIFELESLEVRKFRNYQKVGKLGSFEVIGADTDSY